MSKICLVILIAFSVIKAQTEEIVYDDSLNYKYFPGVWNCSDNIAPTYNFTQTAIKYSGTSAIEVNHLCGGGGGAFGLDRRHVWWEPLYWMYPNQHQKVAFRIYMTGNIANYQDLYLTLDIGWNINTKLFNYLPANPQVNTWYYVEVPIADFNPDHVKFWRLYFWNGQSVSNLHYYLDEVKFIVFDDNTAPVISNVQTTVGPDTAAISWRTNEYSVDTLFYWQNTDTTAVPTGDFISGNHSAALHNLSPVTLYNFIIKSYDHQITGPGNLTIYSGSFTTMPADTNKPVISNVQVTITSSTAVITWQTNEASDSKLHYGISNYSTVSTDSQKVTSHRIAIADLTALTTYQYYVSSADKFGNEQHYRLDSVLTFTTSGYPTAVLSVNKNNTIRPFRDGIRGQALGNWTFFYGRPYPGDSPKLRELTRLIKPGFLRYAGGLWVNNMKWDRNNTQAYPPQMLDTAGNGNHNFWSDRRGLTNPASGIDNCNGGTVVNNAYSYTYQAEEIDRLAAFAKYVNADLMMQVDVTTCDPDMWADMIHYANVEKGYGIKYWEIGNELDLEKAAGTATDIPYGQEYANRFIKYAERFKQTDPSVLVSGPCIASSFDNNWFYPFRDFVNPVTQSSTIRDQGMLGAFTYHYYPLWKSYSSAVTYTDLLNYNHSIPERSRSYAATSVQTFRNLLDARGFSNVPIAITEFNSIAADVFSKLTYNHTNALFMTDMLGRLAYAGADYIAHWELFDLSTASSYGIVNHNNSSISYNWQSGTINLDDKFYPMPVYYAYFMYAQLFGNYLVQSSSSQYDKLSIWASTDSNEPGAIKLMITNMSNEGISAQVNFNGTHLTNGKYYELTNLDYVNSTDKDNNETPSSINGIQFNTTSAQTILESARSMVESGIALTLNDTSFTHVFPPYSATSIILNYSGEINIPDIPVLQSPELVGLQHAADDTVISWRATTGAYKYELEISNTPSFTSTVVDTNRLLTTSWKVRGLNEDSTYYWRVRSIDLSGASSWSATSSFQINGGSLPVELTSFEGKLQSGKVNLVWETATETNNYGFEVERIQRSEVRKQDEGWEKIGFIKGIGNSNSLSQYIFVDSSASSGKYSYRLKQIDNDGLQSYSKIVEVSAAGQIPGGFILQQNYPNPFNPTTKINFAFNENINCSLIIYDQLGQEVKRLYDGVAEAGKFYEMEFDGSGLASGVYFYKLASSGGKNNYTQVKKMLMIK